MPAIFLQEGLLVKDLQIAIADYASENELEASYQIKPSVESLPEKDNEEGDVRFCSSDGLYHVYNEGWDTLDTDDGSGNVDGLVWATDEEVLAMLKEGEREANG